MNVLDLFSGIGGFSLGLERAGMRTVAFCEIDPYCRAVLRKHWPDVPIFQDVRTLAGSDVGAVDVICGGYPCQPFSLAGKRLGSEDDRHLWPEYRRLVQELRPAWVLGENVAGHINMGLDDVLSDLEALGYAARTFVIPACAVDARHRRDRVWIVAHAARPGERVQQITRAECQSSPNAFHDGEKESVADTKRMRQLQPQGRKCDERRWIGNGSWWSSEPDVGRVANWVPARVDRLRALGNAVVPQIPEIIGRAIMRCA